jgi:N-methylhydantoinase A
VEAQVRDRYALRAGETVDGPAIVEERESTTIVPAGARCTVNDDLALVVKLR